jgi:STE24 endopeptidase
VESLDPGRIEAVFGHEIGHVKHRHLAFLGLFFLGSVGLFALLDAGLVRALEAFAPQIPGVPAALAREVAGWAVGLAALGAYFYFVFGHLSRRFERQADIYGCRAVSCQNACPPHLDPNAEPDAPPAPPRVCQGGARLFASALADVAGLNGLPLAAPSWRHGSIAQRIAYVESIAAAPAEAERFQARVTRLRALIVAVLLVATGLAVWVQQGAGPLY